MASIKGLAALFIVFLFASSANSQNFRVIFEWSNINFSWPSQSVYENAVGSCNKYVPQNNQISGIKIYKENMYLTLPRVLTGTPVTLAYLPLSSPRHEPLLHPYPSWDMNVGAWCDSFQNVQVSFQIRKNKLAYYNALLDYLNHLAIYVTEFLFFSVKVQ